MGKLTKDLVRTLSEPGRYSDGDGFILQISPSGGKSWLLRVQVNGRRRDIGLGRVAEVPLTTARANAAQMRKLAYAGIDPLEERRKERVIVPTFEEAAKQVHKELLGAWKNGKHTNQWLATLNLYAFPKLGKLRVDEIEGPLIRDVLADIWLKIPETARRVKQRIGTVLDWSYAKGFRKTEAPMRSLAKGLARQPKKTAHYAAMPHEELPGFVERLRAKPLTVGRVALEALILTAVRSGEIRGARWPELDKDFSVWTIPGERMKAGVTHAIPLSKQAAAVFRTAAGFRVKDCDLVFPGQISQSSLSDMTLLEILRGMDAGVTVHGFRSTFRDWVADVTDYPREVAEAALAHTLENKVEALTSYDSPSATRRTPKSLACLRKAPVTGEKRRQHMRHELGKRLGLAIGFVVDRGIIVQRVMQVRRHNDCQFDWRAIGQLWEFQVRHAYLPALCHGRNRMSLCTTIRSGQPGRTRIVG